MHSSGVRHYVSPRDFLGLIRAFVSLVNEKRAELEDQQVRFSTNQCNDHSMTKALAMLPGVGASRCGLGCSVVPRIIFST